MGTYATAPTRSGSATLFSQRASECHLAVRQMRVCAIESDFADALVSIAHEEGAGTGQRGKSLDIEALAGKAAISGSS